MRFDEVVFACHGDQVLPLLADPSDRERDVFSCFTTTTNVAWLHTDASMLPAQARARASWNYRLAGDADAPPTVTYDLNRLQGLTTRSVLRDAQPDGGSTSVACCAGSSIATRSTRARRSARSERWGEVSGVNRTHYCGAYWRYGFHEDGLNSALRVADALGVEW